MKESLDSTAWQRLRRLGIMLAGTSAQEIGETVPRDVGCEDRTRQISKQIVGSCTNPGDIFK
jgi:hypothetical protein